MPFGSIFGTKGMSRKSPGVLVKWSLLEKMPDGRAIKKGLRLYFIDADEFKGQVMGALAPPEPDQTFEAPLRFRFHAETDLAFVKQLLSEKLVLDRKKRRVVWVKKRQDNHYLDCAVGHLAMAHFQWSPPLKALAAAKSRAARPGPEPERGGGGWIGNTKGWINR
jgi:phage terminase large subunit GpA-like protein